MAVDYLTQNSPKGVAMDSFIPIDSVFVWYNCNHAFLQFFTASKGLPQSHETERFNPQKDRDPISHPLANHKSNSWRVAALVQNPFIINLVRMAVCVAAAVTEKTG